MAVIFVAMCVIGLLASVFDWDWYFRYGRSGPFLDDMFGRDVNRVINGVFCVLVALTVAAVGID